MNKVYHVKTQEEFDALMKELGEKGYTWLVGGKPTIDTDTWLIFKEKTCVELEKNKRLFWDSYENFKDEGYEITEYKETRKETVYHTPTQEDFDALMEELEEQHGYEWWGCEDSPMQRLDFWVKRKEETCVCLHETKALSCDYYSYFKELGYEITEYKAPKKKEKKAMKLEDVFTLKLDEQGEPVNKQTFITQSMIEIQEGYENVLKIEKRLRKQKEYLLKGLEKAVAEEHKALLENVEQLDKALKGSEE